MYEVLWVNLIPFWCMCLTRGLGLLPLVAFCELFVNWKGMIHVVTFWFGGNSWLPYLVSLTCLLSFCEGSHDFCRDNLRGFPLYLWDTPWRFIPITCTDSLSLMVPAWEISGFLVSLVAVTSDLYPRGTFTFFPHFTAFLAERPR